MALLVQSIQFSCSMDTNMKMLESQLATWGTQIDALVTKAEHLARVIPIEYRLSIDDLKVKRATATAMLDAFKRNEKKKWETFKIEIDRAFREIEAAINKIEVILCRLKAQ